MPSIAIDQILGLHRAGKLAEAERLYLEILAAEPDHAVALHLVGIVAYQTGRLGLAVERMGRAVAVKPDFAEAHSNLGNAFKASGRVAEALDSYSRAIAVKPDLPEAHFNRGSVLHELGRRDEAMAAYEQAIALRPDYGDAHCNLGLALKEQDRLDEAEVALRRAIALRPDHAEALSNLGLILNERGETAAAIALLRRAIAAHPGHVRAHANLGLALEATGEVDEAVAQLERALALDPAFVDPLPNLTHLSRKLCKWENFTGLDARLVEMACGKALRVPPFIILSSTADAAGQRAAAEAWAAGIKRPQAQPFSHAPRPRPHRIHLGYLSMDLRNHPVAQLAAELFELHDRDRFQITAYSCGEDDGSAMRRRLEAAFDRFVDLRPVDDAQAAHMIHQDGVDILIDLTGYTTGSRTAVLAARPAPIQVNYLGFPGTLGDFADYIIGDNIVTPANQQPFYTERLVRMPHSYQANDRQRPIAARKPSRSECGLPERGFVFCCFNNTFKITPGVGDAHQARVDPGLDAAAGAAAGQRIVAVPGQ